MEHTSGICRVVPPADWAAGLADEFAIDRAALKFNARVQRVDQLQRKHTAVASQRFWNEYQAWMAANGVKRKGGKVNPVFNGREIELDRFHAAVAHRGGYAAVTEDRGWREIANVLDVSAHPGGQRQGLACLGAGAAAVAWLRVLGGGAWQGAMRVLHAIPARRLLAAHWQQRLRCSRGVLPYACPLLPLPWRPFESQLEDKQGNAAFAVRKLYEKVGRPVHGLAAAAVGIPPAQLHA